MTKKEILQVITMLEGAGVQFSKNIETRIVVDLWYECFKNDKLEDITKAISELIQSSEPLFLNGLIGKIRERLVAKKCQFLDFSIAWQLIREAMHKCHPDIPQETTRAYNSLPPMLKYLVGSAKHLEEMEYCLDVDVLETVEKSNMKKMYESLVAQSKADLQIGKMPMWEQIQNARTNKLNFNITKLLEGKTF